MNWSGQLDPPWFFALKKDDQDRVMEWLSGHGVNPDWCAQVSFDDVGKAHARMYAVDSQGRAEVRDGETQYGDDIVFTPRYLPDVVVDRLAQKE